MPIGQPVLIKLVSADVVHSFWIPTLSGKTDAIPGQTNITWLQADRPGASIQGQCGEYCGLQHAHMGLLVFAEPAAQFEAWRESQLAAGGPANGGRPPPARRCLFPGAAPAMPCAARPRVGLAGRTSPIS